MAGRAYASAAEQAPVYIQHYPDATIAQARNLLAAEVTQDWICVLDADDQLAPGYLDAMRRAYERESRAPTAPLLLTPAVRRLDEGRDGIWRQRKSEFFYDQVDLDKANWLVVGTLVQKDLFERVGGFEDFEHGFEDWSLWYKCHRLGARVVKVPQAIYIQYWNPQSKHRQGWRNRRWQVETHQRVARELEAWTP